MDVPEYVLLIEPGDSGDESNLSIRLNLSFTDSANWGKILANVAQMVSRLYAEEEGGPAEHHLQRISDAIKSELKDPEAGGLSDPLPELFAVPDLFSTGDIDLRMQVDCVKRELRMRGKVYPRWLERDKIKPDTATYELNAMKAVLTTLEKLKDENPDL